MPTSSKNGRGQRPAGPEPLAPVQLSVHDGQGESGQGSARADRRPANGVRGGVLPGDERLVSGNVDKNGHTAEMAPYRRHARTLYQ